jgi:hypothetical protein
VEIHLRTITTRFSICIAVLGLSLFFPVAAFADTAPAAEPCTPPTSTEAGVNVPTGSDAGMYHYDCDVNLWISSHYTYNPITHVTLPRDPIVYTYNDATGMWNVNIWTYVASQGTYVLRTSSVTNPPAGATTVGGPKPTEIATTTNDVGAPATAISTPQGSTASTGSTAATATATTAMAVNNNIGAIATSGGAMVFGNTSAGDATTGNAQSLATVMNMLQSSASGFMPGDDALTFVSNINGDVNGDLLLDPALIGTIQSTMPPSKDTLTVNSLNDTDQTIHNNIDLAATSGNATVDSNTTAGNATTGTATAIANVVNMLNSVISSGKSFLGVININGNLNGDILLPPGFIDQLIASNVPQVTINTDLNLDNNTNQAITNNVTAGAASGQATVDKNTTAGNAATGDATTKITAFNLTHSGIIGSNSLLVFVNVTGTWYGMIFDAPPGSTSAQLGSGITTYANNTSVNTANNVNQAITNDIDVNAQSGDANVLRNTTAGDATTGDAHAAVNLLNIADSNMSLANWFGILFINVFGTWNGSFGVNTSAGDPVVPPSTPAASNPGGTAPVTRQVFRFVPNTSTRNNFVANTTDSSNPGVDTSMTGVVLAATSTKDLARSNGNKLSDPTVSNVHQNYLLPAIGVFAGIALLLGERVRNFRRT